MKKTILGLDLGTNSIGWALLHEDEKTGESTDIFDCGVRIFNEAVEAKTKVPKNQKRRLARSARKLNKRRKMRRDTLKSALINNKLFPENEEELTNLLALTNPYELRAKALDEKVEHYEFGRALYHLNQRRGFLSNRKSGNTKEEGPVKTGISELQKEIKNAGARTLGEYLSKNLDKKRGLHTHRDMFRDEVNLLFASQRKFDPEFYTLELESEIFKIIFFQRPLKIQKHLVGNCRFEYRRRRAAIATLPAQKFRLLQDINNLEVKDPKTFKSRKLVPKEKETLYKTLNKQKTLSWDSARKKLNLHDGEMFNLEEGNKTELKGNSTNATLRNILKAYWDKMSETDKNQLVTDILTIDDEKGFIKRMREVWQFSEEHILKLCKVELEKGYLSLSHKAIKKILPYLESGQLYSEALEAIGNNYVNKPENIKILGKLPDPPELRNPVVQKALWEVRKVVNAIIRKHGKPDIIRVEMARDMKQNKKQKEQTTKNQNIFKKANEEAKRILETEYGILNPSREDILKYKLWKETKGLCVYTGRSISREMLFASGEVDIEHILPYSISLDDSYMNKSLCLQHENRYVKKNRDPFNAYSGDVNKYQEILLRVRNSKMPYPKKKRFEEQKEMSLDNFVDRQLNDTRYICTEVKDYLICLGVKVNVSKGGTTAALRHAWGLNSILSRDGKNEKSREDHRHHIIDAIVVALTSQGLFQKLSRLSSRSNLHTGIWYRDFNLPEPWENFRDSVVKSISDVVVSHASLRKSFGALHEETSYGFVGIKMKGKEKRVLLVHRVPLESITYAQVGKIRDDQIRKLVYERLQQFGDKITKETFAEPLYHPRKNGDKIPINSVRIVTDNAYSSIFRITDEQGNILKCHPYGSNHHVEILEDLKNGKRVGVYVTMMEAIRRSRKLKVPIIQRDHGPDFKFIMSLCVNDLVQMADVDHVGEYYRLQKLSKGQLLFRHHLAAKLDNDYERMIKAPNTLECFKVSVNAIGEVFYCND